MVKDIRIEDYTYPLPEERIARHPAAVRDGCRLLLSAPDGTIYHRRFHELANLLPPGTLMVCNDTRVINARMEFHKDTGARIEIFLLDPVYPSDYALMFQSKGRCVWHCLAGNLKKWKGGALTMTISREGEEELVIKACRLAGENGEGIDVEFNWTPEDVPFSEVIELAGRIPIPPYLNRESEDSDREDYQTIYAAARGSVAAPTAGLHFTPRVFMDLASHNIPVVKLTLHVGAGTFKPVKSDTIGGHPMHTETFSITRQSLRNILDCKRSNRPLAAVGTTTVRTLESLPLLGSKIAGGDKTFHIDQWEAYENVGFTDTITSLESLLSFMEGENLESLTASTAIMIAPGFSWRMTDVLVTNFHQPQSTLLLLVSSFLGESQTHGGMKRAQWQRIYSAALEEDYRFLSYGDACLLMPIRK